MVVVVVVVVVVAVVVVCQELYLLTIQAHALIPRRPHASWAYTEIGLKPRKLGSTLVPE